MMTHRALVNLVQWQVGCSQSSRTLQFAAPGFDICLQEMFVTWHSGGALDLIDRDTQRDPKALLAHLRDRAIDRVFLTPVALQQLAKAMQESAEPLPRLREVISAGETLRRSPAIELALPI